MLWINVRVELIRLDNAHSRPDGAVGLLVKVPYKFYNLLEACDTQSISHIDTEYENVLNSLEVFLQSTECNAIIICGDWNTSFARQNAQTKCLLDYESLRFKSCMGS